MKVESLPDGTSRHSRLPGRRWHPLLREEWRVGRNFVEVKRWPHGSGRRFDNGSFWMEPHGLSRPEMQTLVLRANGQERVMATGEADTIRALGDLLAARTGWRLRVSHSPSPGHGASPLLPVGAVMAIGGLLAGGIGFNQSHAAAARARRLEPVTAAEFASFRPGDPVLATGIIDRSAGDEGGFAVAQIQQLYLQARQGHVWMDIDVVWPPFPLVQRDGAIMVQGTLAALLRPRYHTEGGRRYNGFRPGDAVTVIGTVGRESGQPLLLARTLFGGTPAALVRFLEWQGRAAGALGLCASLVGGLLMRPLALRR